MHVPVMHTHLPTFSTSDTIEISILRHYRQLLKYLMHTFFFALVATMNIFLCSVHLNCRIVILPLWVQTSLSSYLLLATITQSWL